LGIRSGADRCPRVNGPAIAVTTGASPADDVAVATGAVSQTVHCEASPVRIGIAAGAPTMPTVGACGYLASSSALTKVGLLACPAMSRALARFSAGCSRPSTST
jgi:hypothetical protein